MADDIQRIKTDVALRQTVIFIGPNLFLPTANDEFNGLNCKDAVQNCDIAEGDDCFYTTDRIGHSHKRSFTETSSTTYSELIAAIGELGCPILTSNCDLSIEEILNRQPLTWNRYHHADTDLNESILHVYGHVQAPESMIVTDDEDRAAKLRTILGTKTLLFIGYGVTTFDLDFCNLLNWLHRAMEDQSLPIYKLIPSYTDKKFKQALGVTFLESIKEIPYGNTPDDLLSFIKSLKSFTLILRHDFLLPNNRHIIRNKYLNYLIQEYGHISIFGSTNQNINLPLETVFVELKFDPTHPSIKAMKTLEIHDEFKRKLSSPDFFDDGQKRQLYQAIIQRNGYTSEHIYRDFMIDQWLTVLLSNRNIFTEDQARAIENKIHQLKQSIMEQNNFEDTQQYRIQQAYNEFKHLIILGHPGSGKTTLSKWLVVNMAKAYLDGENMLFDGGCAMGMKIPILIPIWKYVDQTKQAHNHPKSTLLHFISENSTCSSSFFNAEERRELALFMIELFIHGNALVIFEGLDEVPAHIDRSDLVKEINMLLERDIAYDHKSQQLIYSIYEQKEINNIKDPHIGNRFIITSRIEGNYFEDLNFYIPRLTIENMSNEALRLFCSSYMQCIRQTSNDPDQLYNDISRNKDIFQLAINPQLASVIAGLYHQCEGRLPEKRIDLYETAIRTMIDRLMISTSYLSTELGLTSTMLWSILQEIAEHLHSRVEGLSEQILQQIIRRCLMEQKQQAMNKEELVLKLVNIFKYQAGLLNEFGQNSFRFIHRTFQEYLSAKSMIYSNGRERSEEIICQNIISKISIPNWKVPLSMAFGILSRSMKSDRLFLNIIRRLLTHDKNSMDTEFSSLVVPFVIIDSLNDMSFSSSNIQLELIGNLANLLLMDYRNMSGFARLTDHQELIHSYFSKLKENNENMLGFWSMEKADRLENLGAYANVSYRLRWFQPRFYETFLRNLHHDGVLWHWPIDNLLRLCSKSVKNDPISRRLKLKNTALRNLQITQYIVRNNDWLCLITALYGGYRNYNTPATISEYYEIADFLNLSDKERTPFLFYYKEVWDKENPTYKMTVHLDTIVPKQHWDRRPVFDPNELYKDSFLTDKILQLLPEEKPAIGLIDELRIQINGQQFTHTDQIEACIALIALGDLDFINTTIQQSEKIFLKHLANRIEQLICTLKDPIARYSSSINKYLLMIYNDMQTNQSKYHISFQDYCQIYLSLTASAGGLPIDTKILAQLMGDSEEKCSLYAEYLAFKLTAGFSQSNPKNELTSLVEQCIQTMKSEEIIQSFLKIADAIQLDRPVRAHPWSNDLFLFTFNDNQDIPIAFFNCLENMNRNLALIIEDILEVFFTEGYLHKNVNLIPLVVCLHFGMMFRGWKGYGVYQRWIPQLPDGGNIKEFLFEFIQSINDPYYKSRALYQLAEFDDARSYELLVQSFKLVEDIPKAVCKFQVLEKIFNVTHLKEVSHSLFIQQIVDRLILTLNNIDNLYDQVIASVRLSFYGSESFRYKYLSYALQTLMQMDEDDQQIQLIIKLKPLIGLYDDLHTAMNQFINGLKSRRHQDMVRCYYGAILSTQKSSINTSHSTVSDREDYVQFQSLFSLFAQLNDVRLMIGETETLEQLWNNLFKDPHNQSHVIKILEIALKTELFLTPQVAIIFDELIRQGNEDCIFVLCPFIIKPSNEVLPIVQRWFTDYSNKPIGRWAALLFVEAKRIFASAVDTIIDLLQNDNDQLRYRAQRVFQHPERDVEQPSKRISVIGERAMIKILENMYMKECSPRIRAYLNTFFFDLLWDDPQVFDNIYEYVIHSENTSFSYGRRMCIFERLHFINSDTWNTLMQSAQSSSSHPLYIEALLQSTMKLTRYNQITQDNWAEFARVLSTTDTSQFRQRLYFSQTDVQIIQFIISEISALNTVDNEVYFEILEAKLISASTVQVEDLFRSSYAHINLLQRCTFTAANELNEDILNMLNNIPLTRVIIENLIKWLILKMADLKTDESHYYSLMLTDCLLSLIAACVQKENYLYRKITNAPHFDKHQFIKLLDKMVHFHPFFLARGSAFILLAALDQTDHKVIINAMSTLFDENCVKEYAMIGMALIHLSPNELLDDLLSSLTSESAVKTYEILKIITQFALNEQIDASGKSKIINYLANEIGQLKSKKPVSYYYTDVKIPFTTTLENELYKAWIKTQGLSGKTQYAVTHQSS